MFMNTLRNIDRFMPRFLLQIIPHPSYFVEDLHKIFEVGHCISLVHIQFLLCHLNFRMGNQ